MSLSDNATSKMFVHQEQGLIHTLAIGHEEQNSQKPMIAAWFTLIKGEPLRGQETANFKQITRWQNCRDFVQRFRAFEENKGAVEAFLRLIDQSAKTDTST